MTLNTDALVALRDGRAAKTAPTEPTYREGMVLALDQSLVSTGWAAVTYDWDGLRVLKTGMLKVDSVGNRIAETLPRSVELFRDFCDLLDAHAAYDLVHESPVVAMRNSDSSVMAATALRIACEVANGREVKWMPNRQAVYKIVVGDHKAPKSEMRKAIEALFPGGWNGPANEHTRDAIGLAVAYLRSDR